MKPSTPKLEKSLQIRRHDISNIINTLTYMAQLFESKKWKSQAYYQTLLDSISPRIEILRQEASIDLPKQDYMNLVKTSSLFLQIKSGLLEKNDKKLEELANQACFMAKTLKVYRLDLLST